MQLGFTEGWIVMHGLERHAALNSVSLQMSVLEWDSPAPSEEQGPGGG